MNNTHTITSGEPVDDIECHLRVSAGPGAGKTHWLSVQIRHIIRTSERLQVPRRVCCISYTNAAVTEIQRRLGDAADRAEVSTIHSFHYRNVVRPYLWLLKDDTGNPLVAANLVDGHDELRPNFGWVKDGLRRAGYAGQIPQETLGFVKGLCWRRDEETSKWSLKHRDSYRRPGGLYATQAQINEIKRSLWDRGVIDHDDLLYFAFRILEDNPIIVRHLAERFPYVLVDEFQDTVPIQTQILKWLAEQGTRITVIGDPEQSIYSFAGASPEDFSKFALSEQRNLQILGNRRSTARIIGFLNALRSDGITQEAIRDTAGEPVVILVGGHQATFAIAQAMADDGREELVVLARNNSHVTAIRAPRNATSENPWDTFYEADSARAEMFERLIRGTEIARQGDIALGMRDVLKAVRLRTSGPLRCETPLSEENRKAIAVGVIEYLISNGDGLQNQSLNAAYGALTERLSSLHEGLTMQGVRSGSFKSFADTTHYGALVTTVELPDENRPVRTIHRAKGQEFPNVYLRLEDSRGPSGKAEKVVATILSKAKSTEESRLVYVACSRPTERLFISLPSLPPAIELELSRIGAVIRHCPVSR